MHGAVYGKSSGVWCTLKYEMRKEASFFHSCSSMHWTCYMDSNLQAMSEVKSFSFLWSLVSFKNCFEVYSCRLSCERSPQNHLLFNPAIPSCSLEVLGKKPLNFFQNVRAVWFWMGLLSAFQRYNLSSPMALKASSLLCDGEIYGSSLKIWVTCRQVGERDGERL